MIWDISRWFLWEICGNRKTLIFTCFMFINFTAKSVYFEHMGLFGCFLGSLGCPVGASWVLRGAPWDHQKTVVFIWFWSSGELYGQKGISEGDPQRNLLTSKWGTKRDFLFRWSIWSIFLFFHEILNITGDQ